MVKNFNGIMHKSTSHHSNLSTRCNFQIFQNHNLRFLTAVILIPLFVFSWATLIPLALSQGTTIFHIEQRSILNFKSGFEGQSIFGSLKFMGGLELTSSNQRFGGISGLLSLEGGHRYLAVSDTGDWFTWKYNTQGGQSVGIVSNASFSPILDEKGRSPKEKYEADAEALTIFPDGNQTSFLISFEGTNRIAAWPAPYSRAMIGNAKILDFDKIGQLLQVNKGIECLAVAPPTSHLSGAIIALAERGIDDNSDMQGWILGKSTNDSLKIKRRDNFDLTDAAFLANGDLLILERKFSIFGGFGMRIRRITGSTIKPGKILDGTVLIEANYEHEIDNMEALAIHQDPHGETILTIMSDNNHSFFQRTLFLTFRLQENDQN